MALVSLSSSIARGVFFPSKPAIKHGLCSPERILPFLSATISSKTFREPREKPAPYPYKEKNYGVFRSIFDKTTSRFDENSKIIVVEGPIASGKTEFAKKLASELEMCHIEEANPDLYYINGYGKDLRDLDPQLPIGARSFDEKQFCKNPTDPKVIFFQVLMYRLRFSIYIDALAHVLSTGQGVVMERCPWSDMVFTEALRSQDYINKNSYKAYYEYRRNTISQILRPHLVIYLDVPVSQVQSNIKKRARSWETNSTALTTPYLQKMEEAYKTKYLRDISEHSELLMYDWSETGDIEVIVEDIERIDFDKYALHDKKLKDWRIQEEREWANLRINYADCKDEILSTFNIPLLYCPELFVSGEDQRALEALLDETPGYRYEEGYNEDQGDTGLLFKTKTKKYVV